MSVSFADLGIALALAGVANGVYHPCDHALPSRSIAQDRMARAFSIHTFAGFLGNALAPLILVWCAINLNIWAAFIVSAGLGLLVFLLLVIRAAPAVKTPPITTATTGEAAGFRFRMSVLGATPTIWTA